MLLDWKLASTTVDDGEGVVYMTFAAEPCSVGAELQHLTLEEIELVGQIALSYLNTFAHVPLEGSDG